MCPNGTSFCRVIKNGDSECFLLFYDLSFSLLYKYVPSEYKYSCAESNASCLKEGAQSDKCCSADCCNDPNLFVETCSWCRNAKKRK